MVSAKATIYQTPLKLGDAMIIELIELSALLHNTLTISEPL